MLVPGDLGFPSLVVVFLFFFGPIFGFAVRWKWRKAVSRQKEIIRLMAMASEEAERAELEASAELGTVYAVRQSQCVVCYCPTTTRCSRCKAVHYCSGKCQIIHWRQGHKDECHPPQFNGLGVNTKLKVASGGENQELHRNNLEADGKLYAESIKTFNEEQLPASSESYIPPELISGRDDGKVAHFAGADGEGISSKSPSATPWAQLPAFVTTNESGIGMVPVLTNPDIPDKPKFDDIAPKECDTTTDVNNSGQTKSPTDASVDSSHLSNLKQARPSSTVEVVNCVSATLGSSTDVSDECKISEPSMANSDFWAGTLDSNGSGNCIHDDSTPSSLSEGGDDISADSKSSSHFSFVLSQHVIPNSPLQNLEPKSCTYGNESPMIPAEKQTSCSACLSKKVVTNAFVDEDIQTLNSGASASVSNDDSSSQPQKPKRMRSLSCSATDYSTLSSNGGHSVSTTKSSMVEGAHKMHLTSTKIASSSSDDTNGLRTSMRKVVQQFKTYKILKHYPTGFGVENTEKHNHKMLFPYEFFIKLYHWNKVELRPCGLVNCGNSCYANVVFQCLAFTRPLTAYLLQGLHSKACRKKEWCFTCEFESLVLKAKEEKSPISPVRILSNLESIGSHLGHGREEDAHEFLRYAIDTMQSVCLKEAGEAVAGTSAEETTLIGLIFGGYLRSKIKCIKCHGKSVQHERMMDLTVEIHGDIGTLEEALGRFTATEILDGENKYYCSRCKSYEKAKKKLTLLEAPNILTIALKRFQTGKFGKLNKSVQFPEILNMAPYISGMNDKSPIYRLYAVVVHLDVMNAAFSGHYICYVRNIQGKWFKIDDSTVEPVEIECALSKGAYMLLYARCSPRAPGLIRNSIFCNDVRNKGNRRCLEASHSGKHTLPKTRPSDTVPKTGPWIAHRRPEGLSYWRSCDGPYSFESIDSFDRMFHSMQRIPKADSSSDNSSLFSCSDEGSCSTESTRDSSSTDDFSEYIFGEAGHTLNSPLRDFDVMSSPSFSRSSQMAVSEMHPSGSPETSGFPRCRVDQVIGDDGVGKCQCSIGQSLQDRESFPILYSDTHKHCRKLTSCSNNSYRKTDIQRLEHCKPCDMKSGVHLRRSTRDRTAEPFY